MSVLPESDLVAGLQAQSKSIPCDYYYDDYGSKLFDIQCMQEDYYLFRSEKEIMTRQGADILGIMQPEVVVDLGCGTCEKTIELLQHNASWGCTESPVRCVILVDVNKFILDLSAAKIKARFPEIEVIVVNLSYVDALAAIDDIPGRKAFLLLGGNVGNMRNRQIRRMMETLKATAESGDFCLIGVDKHKSAEIIERAYNDRNGIARLTNLNVLSHLNNLYSGDINTSQFLHKAIYFPDEFTSRSFLISMRKQSFTLSRLGVSVTLELGEPILTEIERKFEIPYFHDLLENCGWRPFASFHDEGDLFNVEVFRA